MREIFINVEKLLTQRSGKAEKREMKVSEARPLLEDSEAQRMVSDEAVRGTFYTLLCVVRMAALFKNLPASFRTPPVEGCFKAHGQ